MSHKLNDQVSVNVEYPKTGTPKILIRDPLLDSIIKKKKFKIIMIHEFESSYSILIDDDMLGCHINEFHVQHYDVDKKLLGKKFATINDRVII